MLNFLSLWIKWLFHLDKTNWPTSTTSACYQSSSSAAMIFLAWFRVIYAWDFDGLDNVNVSAKRRFYLFLLPKHLRKKCIMENTNLSRYFWLKGGNSYIQLKILCWIFISGPKSNRPRGSKYKRQIHLALLTDTKDNRYIDYTWYFFINSWHI